MITAGALWLVQSTQPVWRAFLATHTSTYDRAVDSRSPRLICSAGEPEAALSLSQWAGQAGWARTVQRSLARTVAFS